MFTDEWGGGTSRTLPRDRPAQLGRECDLRHRRREARVPQLLQDAGGADASQENCVAHLPSHRPGSRSRHLGPGLVPGRRVDRSTSRTRRTRRRSRYFDRGPISATTLVLGGLWSTYYYNGAVYGSEIARGFDVVGLMPTAELSENEIDAAAEVELERLTPQHQPRLINPPSFAIVRSFRRPARPGRCDRRGDARPGRRSSSTGPRASAARQAEGAAQPNAHREPGSARRRAVRRAARGAPRPRGRLGETRGMGRPSGAPSRHPVLPRR